MNFNPNKSRMTPKICYSFFGTGKVQDTVPICVSRLSQIAALGALDAGREWVNQKVYTLAEGRTAIIDALSPLESVMGGSGAMYVMGKLPEGIDDLVGAFL